MVPDARVAEYEGVVSSVTEWAESQAAIVAVGVVGSWARGNQHSDSDVDLVVLTPHKTAYTATDGWIKAAIGQPAPVVRRTEWGHSPSGDYGSRPDLKSSSGSLSHRGQASIRSTPVPQRW